MIRINMYTTIITLYKQGNSQRKIAKLTRIDRKTVRKIVNRYVKSGTDLLHPMNDLQRRIFGMRK